MVGELEGGGPFFDFPLVETRIVAPRFLQPRWLNMVWRSYFVVKIFIYLFIWFCFYSVKDLFSSFSLPLVTCPVRFPSFIFVGILQEGAWTFTVFLPEAKDINLFKPHPELLVREEPLCGCYPLCLQLRDWVLWFFQCPLFYFLPFPWWYCRGWLLWFCRPPGSMASQDRPIWGGLDRGRFFPEFLDCVQGYRWAWCRLLLNLFWQLHYLVL